MKITWIILALLAGAILPIQAGLNARMGRAIENPVYAALISFVTGTIFLFVYILLTRQQANWEGIRSVPATTWLAGLLGAFFVTIMILAFPRIGPALTFGLVVLGQMTISLLLDHFNTLVANPHPINLWRVFGILLIIAGVVIVRKF